MKNKMHLHREEACKMIKYNKKSMKPLILSSVNIKYCPLLVLFILSVNAYLANM